MEEPNVVELFRQHARIETELYIEIPVYETQPRRVPKRKKVRLHKKWLKRYGTREVLVDTYNKPIRGYWDIKPSELRYPITLRQSARAKPTTIARMPVLNYSATATEATIKIETLVYKFPHVAQMQRLSPEFLREMQDNSDLAKMITERFWEGTRRLVEEGTTVSNGW